jgi:excisionase family DNA binding protein
MVQDSREASVKYSVRERPEPIAPKEPQPADLHGLTKPVYTVSETASLLGTSRRSVYELVRRGLGCVRLGRRVLIPRSKIIAMLNDVFLDQRQHLPARERPAAVRRYDDRPKKSTLPQVQPLFGRRRRRKKSRKKIDRVPGRGV